MRYVRFAIDPRGGYLDEIERLVATTPEIDRVSLQNLNRLEDGTITCLYEVDGDPDVVEAVVSDCPALLEGQVSAGEQLCTVFCHFQPAEIHGELLDLLTEHELVLDTPLVYTESGRLQVGVVGADDVISEAMASVTETVAVDVEQLTEYEPEGERLFSILTDRQQEALLAALDAGYYRVPREATQEDVADRLGRSPGTVGEHLRRAEQTLLDAIVPR